MLKIIFWNVNKKDLSKFVCAMSTATNTDVVVLCENNVPAKKTLKMLQENVAKEFYCPIHQPTDRFHCFCRNRQLDMSEIHSGNRTSVRKLKIGTHETLLALFHGFDIRNYDSESRQSSVQSLADDMKLVIDQQRTNKLILLGDFNMNPYERGMNLAAGLNAMMTKSCVERGSRRFQDKDYDFYYNPMWSLFGDNTDGPAGTVYDTSNQGPYGWSMLDQIIINHSIVGIFHSVKILTEAGTASLMNRKGHPDTNNASDHFPILVSFFE
ncbi:hypothetical protein IQ254_29370 [Nodosilinea sp. LEGE 07088]|uniref:endonuclease/exonuclease/phosphatase family protein n=1 Tax=Nodosilinea sp. LEGE 07088 TaxID=2777968 RepID=UPI0018828899|nr:endonuclease/exonuclease/phosphatase family protein [Nodosilinea sp. LEGE 07088]MBE9141263.1 hypothetical protein [Nodosilinea sp. LEGE 07088]